VVVVVSDSSDGSEVVMDSRGVVSDRPDGQDVVTECRAIVSGDKPHGSEVVASTVGIGELGDGVVTPRRVWFDLPPFVEGGVVVPAPRHRSPRLPLSDLDSSEDSSASEVFSPYPRRRRVMTSAGQELKEALKVREFRRQNRKKG